MIFSRSLHKFALPEAYFGLQLLLQLLRNVFHFDIFLEIDTLCLLNSDIETHLGHLIHLIGFLLAVEVFFIQNGLLMLKTTSAIEEHLVDMMGLLLTFICLSEHRICMFNKGTALDCALEGSCHLKCSSLPLRWTDIDIAADGPGLLLAEKTERAIKLILHCKWIEFGKSNSARVLPSRAQLILLCESLELIACVIELFHCCFRSHRHILVPGVLPCVDIIGGWTRIHDAISVVVALSGVLDLWATNQVLIVALSCLVLKKGQSRRLADAPLALQEAVSIYLSLLFQRGQPISLGHV